MSYTTYEMMKAEWIRNNPTATPQEYQKAMREIARKLGI